MGHYLRGRRRPGGRLRRPKKGETWEQMHAAHRRRVRLLIALMKYPWKREGEDG